MARQILGVVSPARAEALLIDWANLSRPWPLEITKESLAILARSSDEERCFKRRYKDLLDHPQFPVLGHLWLRDMLRRAWDASGGREREWLCFRFRDAYSSLVRRYRMSRHEVQEVPEGIITADFTGWGSYEPPEVTAVEAAIFHFQHQANRARHCRNPECLTPYFFVSKHTQKFCSTPCALPTQRASKRRWWTQNRGKKKRK